MDKCNRCDNLAIYYVLLEDEFEPYRTHVEELCEECQLNVSGKIEVWSEKEWDG